MRNLLAVFSLIALSVLIMNSCASTKLVPTCASSSEVTYSVQIKPIIDTYCLECHSEYSDYAGLSKDLTNGHFEEKVLTKQSMPKGTTLSQKEIDLILCWKDNGYKE